MQTHDISRHIIGRDATILEALAQLNRLSGDAMTLIVVDSSDHIQGTLTDGDVRRSLIAGHTLADSVAEVMHTTYSYIDEGCYDPARFKQLRHKGIRLLPVVDKEGRVVSLIDLEHTRNILPLSALIMAGGEGQRLRPLTADTPKPLLQIEGKAIIDYNIEALAAAGIDDIVVSTRYLADRLDEHFALPVAGVKVRCVRETAPLGTVGALTLVDDFRHSDILVMNSDLLTDISFEDMYLSHKADDADITVAAIPYTLSVPYAILATEGRRVTSLEEKPVYSYYANAGIYIIGPRAAALLRRDERTDATDLIDRAIAAGLKVEYFPINGTWIDVGTPADFRHAAEIMKYHRGRT